MSEGPDSKIFGLKQEQCLYILSAITTITALVLLIWFSWGYYKKHHLDVDKKSKKDKVSQKRKCEQRRKLDGACIKDTKFKKSPKLIGVMIENHIESRPSLNLSEARVVYEAPVEGNISRFLALYTKNQSVDKVGPVRSARPYFVDWVREYSDVMYAHVGGSPSALEYIKKISLNDLDQFSKGWHFWRSKNRDQPHNVFISSKLWNKALEEYSELYKDKEYKGWKFGQVDSCGNATSTDCISEVKVSFSEPYYSATWNYNTTSKKYERYQNGKPHQDKDGDQIQVDTIILQHVDTQVVDEIGRLDMDTVGQGKAEIFMKGNRIEGKWNKKNKNSRTIFKKDGEEILLQGGKIWVEVVNNKTSVEIN